MLCVLLLCLGHSVIGRPVNVSHHKCECPPPHGHHPCDCPFNADCSMTSCFYASKFFIPEGCTVCGYHWER